MTDIQVFIKPFLFPGGQLPQFQKCCRQTPDSLSLQPYAGILPVSIGMGSSEIFIGQIVSAGESHFSVNDGDLPVIPVIHKQIQRGNSGIEYTAPDAPGIEPPGKLHVHISHGTEIIIQQPDFHACFCLPLQNLQKFPKGGAILHNEILHKNKGFRLFQILFHGFQRRLSQWIVSQRCIAPDRAACKIPQVTKLICIRRILCRKLLKNLLLLHQKGCQSLPDLPQPLSGASGISQRYQQIQRKTHHGKQQDQNDPGGFLGCVHRHTVQIQHHRRRKQSCSQRNPGIVFIQLGYRQQHPQNLNQYGNTHQTNAHNAVGPFCFLRDHGIPPLEVVYRNLLVISINPKKVYRKYTIPTHSPVNHRCKVPTFHQMKPD